MNTELLKPADSSTSDQVIGAEIRKPKKLTPTRARWSNAEIAQHNQKIKNLEYKQAMEALYV